MYPVNMYPWVKTSTNFSNFPRWGGYCHIYLKLLKFSQVGWILPHLPQTSQIFPGGFTGQIKFYFPLVWVCVFELTCLTLAVTVY